MNIELTVFVVDIEADSSDSAHIGLWWTLRLTAVTPPALVWQQTVHVFIVTKSYETS